MEQRKTDEQYMLRALQLAKQGQGRTNPNPMVGAVLVKDGRVIGEGYHRKYGDLHAERDALFHCTEDPKGATAYVTLEPCCHYGKQPPCTEALIEAGVKRVVVGSGDPNPKVAGQGLEILRSAGMEVTVGVCKEECMALNEIFFHYIQTGRPFTAMKYAMTLDGKLACYTGKSKWITGEEARAHVHKLRNAYASILIGTGTLLNDDPLLTCRLEGGNNPLRIVCSTNLDVPLTCQIMRTAKEVPTLIATCCPDKRKYRSFTSLGAEVLCLPKQKGGADLERLLEELGKRGIDSLLVEGGSAIHGSFAEQRLVQKIYTYVGAQVFGGLTAPGPVGGTGASAPEESMKCKVQKVLQLGNDVLLESEVL